MGIIGNPRTFSPLKTSNELGQRSIMPRLEATAAFRRRMFALEERLIARIDAARERKRNGSPESSKA